MPDTIDIITAPDTAIEAWYQNPATGGVFGFGLPLHPSIPPQIKAGNLVRCAGPGGGIQDSAVSVLEADGDGAADPTQEPEQDAALYPCSECGEVAAKDEAGYYTDHCAKHTPKTGGRSAKKQV